MSSRARAQPPDPQTLWSHIFGPSCPIFIILVTNNSQERYFSNGSTHEGIKTK